MVGEGEQKFLPELTGECLSDAKIHVEIQNPWEKPLLSLVGVEPEQEESCSCIPVPGCGKPAGRAHSLARL